MESRIAAHVEHKRQPGDEYSIIWKHWLRGQPFELAIRRGDAKVANLIAYDVRMSPHDLNEKVAEVFEMLEQRCAD
jgi:hypothetical protein